MLRFDALPERTAALLTRLKDLPQADGLTLIGGTALALQVAHRESEDLDLVWRGERLPRDKIEAILAATGSQSVPTNITDEASKLYAENEGIDLEDLQQDWQVDDVKVTFFAPFMSAQLDVYAASTPIRLGTIDVLDKESIFKLKSSLLLDRKTSRDLFDLWFFIEQEGKTVDDIVKAMDARKAHLPMDTILNKIAPVQFALADPGFKPILPNAPAGKAELLRAMDAIAFGHRETIAYNLALQAQQEERSMRDDS